MKTMDGTIELSGLKELNLVQKAMIQIRSLEQKFYHASDLGAIWHKSLSVSGRGSIDSVSGYSAPIRNNANVEVPQPAIHQNQEL
jgi:hypothetical protein